MQNASETVLKTVIKPWGNSQGIRISKDIMQYMGFSLNDELIIELQPDGLLLKKKAERKSLQEYAASYGGLGPYEEFDWGEGIGFERFIDE